MSDAIKYVSDASFDQDVINGSSVEALLIGVSQFRVMAKHVLSDLQIPFPISKGV